MEEPNAPVAPKKKNWFLRHKVFSVLGALFLFGAIASANPSTQQTSNKPRAHVPKIETKSISEKKIIPFNTQQVEDATIVKGTTVVKQEGVNGEKTIIYEVTYADGSETNRKETSETVSLVPIPKIIAIGTKVPTTNSPPQATPTTPSTNSSYSDATALCVDGTYSYSQHASGTCSHHGGVAQWINHP